MGISFNLKGAQKGKFTLKKPEKEVKKINVLNDSDDEDNKVSIESFEKKEEIKEDIVIRPDELISTIKPKESVKVTGDSKRDMTREEEARKSLMEDESYQDTGRQIKVSSQVEDPEEDGVEAYKEIPVEEFGAALLRGMGWNKANERKVSKPNLEKRKQGLLLGLGAKSVNNDEIAQELLGSRAKFSIPVVKKNKATGEIIRED
ncbi:pre-mRNA-splicing factor Spp2p [[Candida] jaroonii]|uniref:Pre-mRNA-splicing factor Spp2p n=1 Tax=[Candida] jaroonii TaxID=467808 RepID=A0ACA9YCF0_9ASCO|nr:pre-mRNA-splicing factor Spp2p [[Candida] jaroonii]